MYIHTKDDVYITIHTQSIHIYMYIQTHYYNIYIIVGYNATNGEIECHYMYTTTDYTLYFNALILQWKLMFRNE